MGWMESNFFRRGEIQIRSNKATTITFGHINLFFFSGRGFVNIYIYLARFRVGPLTRIYPYLLFLSHPDVLRNLLADGKGKKPNDRGR